MEKEYSDRAREERQHQLEMEARKEEFAASEHQRKIEELEADQQFQAVASEKMQKSPMESHHVIETHQPMKGPKLPPFDEAKDNIDAYIQRFERYATAQNWIRINWGSHLSALLTGRAMDVFARLPPSRSLDYDELKNALYKRLEMTYVY